MKTFNHIRNIGAAMLLSLVGAHAQNMSINSTGAAPNATAALDIASTTKGILIPRVALVSNDDPIDDTKPEGLLIYNNGGAFGSSGYYYWSGATWNRIGLPSGTTGQTMRHNGSNWTASSLIYNDGANVGIGSTTPRAALNTLDGSESTTETNFTQAVADAGLLVTTEYTNGAYTPGVFWSTSVDNPTMPKAGIYLQLAPNSSKMIFGTSTLYPSGITNSALVINNNGNIGIGLDAPESQLHTTGSITFDAFAGAGNQLIKVNNLGVVSTAALGASTDMLLGDATYAPITDKAIRNQSSTTQTADFRINGNGLFEGGNVGIGTLSPSYNLQVIGTTGFNEYLYHNSDANTYLQLQDDDVRFYAGAANFLQLSEAGSDALIVNEDGTNMDFRVEGDANDHLLFVDASSDRIGIGTSLPMVKLHVDGDQYIVDELTVGATSLPPADFRMMIRNTAAADGLLIKAGGNAGDIALRIEDQDQSFNLLDVETGTGHFVTGETYATTLSTRGEVFGIDNQCGASSESSMNTENGVYRIAGQEISPYNIGGGIICTELSATASTSTTSTSYTQINGMSITPAAGNYMVKFSASSNGTAANQQLQTALYVGGSVQAFTEGDFGFEVNAANDNNRFSIQSDAIVTVNGSQAIEMRYKTNTGTFNVHERSMILLKVSDLP
jgi:hypothetical protein